MTFRETVYQLTMKIPRGKVATYGQLAHLAGRRRSARAVGAFMRTNPNAPVVPCHRVVAAGGTLRGYSGEGGPAKKKKMLVAEGVSFNGSKVDLEKSGWKV